MANITVINSSGYITINDGDTIDIEKAKVSIETIDNDVLIRWGSASYRRYSYDKFSSPSGASAAAVAALIAAFLDTGGGADSNVKTVSKTIGIFGATGVDYNFAANADALIQSIQMGSSIVPAHSPITSIVVTCTEAVTDGGGATNATNDVGSTSGGSEHLSSIQLQTLNQEQSASAQISSVAAASSVFFSITPSVNWSTLLTGKWQIRITYNDNSQN